MCKELYYFMDFLLKCPCVPPHIPSYATDSAVQVSMEPNYICLLFSFRLDGNLFIIFIRLLKIMYSTLRAYVGYGMSSCTLGLYGMKPTFYHRLFTCRVVHYENL